MKSPIRYEHIYRTVDGVRETYMKRLVIGRLNLHLFYRGDGDEDPHDHPWSFWTFPLSSYVEEVYDPIEDVRRVVLVNRWRWHFRRADHAHRVLGKFKRGCGELVTPGRWVTVVWKTPKIREWGFYTRAGWTPWRDYLVSLRRKEPV